MPVMDGVRIGPLDPDKGERFGQVGGQTTARQLVRHHTRMLPPSVRAALTRQRNGPRSSALDADEVEKAIRKACKDAGEELPKDATIVGPAVHGEEDHPSQMVVGFTFTVESGRVGKGFIPYEKDALPKSLKAGNVAAEREKLKEQGIVQTVSSASDEESESADASALQKRVEELESQLAEAQRETPADDGAGAADNDPAEPWPKYEGMNSKDVQKKLRDDGTEATAQAVVAYEEKNANRSGVLGVANSILDRKSG